MASNGEMIIVIVMAALFFEVCMAAQFTVGGNSGWNLGNNYQNWADGKTYQVGDVLVFNYGGSHSVIETDATGFQSCSPSNVLLQDNSGDTQVTLKTAGKHYFICGSAGHCQSGMKFSVAVVSSSSTPSGTISPPAGGTTTPGTANTTPTTHKSSGSGVLPPITVFVNAGIMSMASLLFFFL